MYSTLTWSFGYDAIGLPRSALLPRQRRALAWNFFLKAKALPQGSAGDVGCASRCHEFIHVVAIIYLYD
jgi:hypothetical protein